ncbi:MAG: AMP-binding protein [Deltaproteobacteria bacterium]|nr:AMP-binding protein [Deltaproteobacteria bacterium]
MNVAQNLERSALYFPDRPAVIEGEREVSLGEFNQESSRVATALMGLGVSPGEHVALCAPNSYEWLAFYFGALKAGAVAVTISSALSRAELAPLLADARPRVLFTSEDKLDALGGRQDHPYLDKVISAGGDIPFQKLIKAGSPSFKAIERERDDTAAVLYTGGTTGRPKGVMLTHENIKVTAHNTCHCERSSQEDRALCFLPLNHVFAQIYIANSLVYAGGCLVIQDSFDLERVLEAVRRQRVTKFYAVPTIYHRLLQLDRLQEKLGSLGYCFSAAASLAAEAVREWRSRLGLTIHEGYGLTETASLTTYNHYHRHVVGSVGSPVNTIEVQISDSQGRLRPVGEEGEIVIQGPNVMKGYLNDPDGTEAAFRGEWLRSGDIGRFDEEGYLYLVDRIKDLIITGGENVYPREIAEALYLRPEVGECSIIGLPDQEWGEKVIACIALKKRDQPVNAAKLKSFLQARLAPCKVPKEFIFLNELPKSSTGKILKRQLKKEIAARIDRE